jgi:hypothetical protein
VISEIAFNHERKIIILDRLVHSLQLFPLLSWQFLFKSRLSLILSLSFLFLIASCTPVKEEDPSSHWKVADWQSLSTYDDEIIGGDFIAGYVRNAGSDLQLRFDLLEVNPFPVSDFYIALDTQPGGSTQLPVQGNADIEWDTLLVLPASGNPEAFSPTDISNNESSPEIEDKFHFREDLIPRIIRIPWQDYILVSINQNSILQSSPGIKIQAFSTDPESRVIKDSLGPFSSNGPSLRPAPVVLAFWNTFPAYSPAQSLRRWDGAHTGPFGERHGLSILLNNVKRFNVPVVLLDLRNPFSFSALDYLDQMPLIREMISQQLIILPDAILGSPSYPAFPSGLPDWALGKYHLDLQAISKEFDIPSSRILYSPYQMEEVIGNYSLVIGPDNQSSSFSTERYLPYPDQIPEESQATTDGIPLAIRKTLIDNMLHINMNRAELPLLVLGGSLPDSSFADPASATATISYIANHPWIKALADTDLRSLPGNVEPILLPGKTISISAEDFLPSNKLANISKPGDDAQNPLDSLQWTSALSLYSPLPPEPESLPSLRTNYSGQPGIAQAAASWSENPQPRMDCQTDPDDDGTPECILASNEQFAVIDLEGGRLVAYFTITDSGFHQIIAPSSQLIVGLGDPSTWILDAGEGADPHGIHGAFVDSPPPWEFYNISINGEQLVFTSPDQEISKSFLLLENGLQVNYSSSEPISVQIPIVIDPWNRFSPNWRENFNCGPIKNGYSCKVTDDTRAEILSNSAISAHSFTDSYSHLQIPEDPNLNYPAGHYLPFPMVLLDLDSTNSFSVVIQSVP